MSKYNRYRFKTYSVDDPRPLIDMAPIKMPWWCTGYSYNDDYPTAIIICYLPSNHPLSIYWYWDDAFDIEREDVEEIIYTDRFPKPLWCE